MKKEGLKIFLNYAPVNAIWNGAKIVYKYGHKGLTASKALLFYIKWSGRDKKELYGRLEGVDGIKPFHLLHWKHEVCYFTGTMSGKRVFIKTGGKVNTTAREDYAMSYASKKSKVLKKHIPAIISSGTDFIIEEMVEGKKLSEGDQFVNQLFEIYTELKRTQIFHLDIRPDNFIVKSDGTLILIDFGYALVQNRDIFDRVEKTDKTKEIIKDVGSSFSPQNGTVDDAYSMLLTLKYVCPSLLQKYPLIWKELNEDIGKRAVSLEG